MARRWAVAAPTRPWPGIAAGAVERAEQVPGRVACEVAPRVGARDPLHLRGRPIEASQGEQVAAEALVRAFTTDLRRT